MQFKFKDIAKFIYLFEGENSRKEHHVDSTLLLIKVKCFYSSEEV